MLEVINKSIELLLDPDTKEMYEAESYTLSSRRKVVWDYKSQSWQDRHGRRYTPVTLGSVVGFNMIDTLSKQDKELMARTPEGKAYVEYNEKIGGDRLAPEVPFGYPAGIQEYIEEHGIEQIYKECISKGISWEEMFSGYYAHDPELLDRCGVDVLWDP